jgi:hypothetical protein
MWHRAKGCFCETNPFARLRKQRAVNDIAGRSGHDISPESNPIKPNESQAVLQCESCSGGLSPRPLDLSQSRV